MAMGSSSSEFPLQTLSESHEKITRLRPGHPRDFRSKPFDMVLFPLENLCRDKHGEIRVFDTKCFDLGIEPAYRMRQSHPNDKHNGARWMVSQIEYDHGLRI